MQGGRDRIHLWFRIRIGKQAGFVYLNPLTSPYGACPGSGIPPSISSYPFFTCQYYLALREADSGNLLPFTRFIARAVSDALSHYLAVAGGEESLVPLGELAKQSSYSQEYLSLAARKGLLDATKIDDTWHASRRALDMYIREHGRT